MFLQGIDFSIMPRSDLSACLQSNVHFQQYVFSVIQAFIPGLQHLNMCVVLVHMPEIRLDNGHNFPVCSEIDNSGL